MTRFRTRLLSLVTVACAASLVLAPAQTSAQSGAGTFAFLPLVAGDTGMPYQVFPTPSERAELGRSIVAQVQANNGGTPVPDARVASVLAHAGIDQNTAYHACEDAVCARKVGRALHADTVIFGSVTRALAMIWGSQVSLVDVATGRVQGPYELGYKGDFITLETGVGTLAQVVSNRLIADAAERRHARTMAHR